MDEGEMENLIRPLICKEPNVGFTSTSNLAYMGFLNIKQARPFIKHIGTIPEYFRKSYSPI